MISRAGLRFSSLPISLCLAFLGTGCGDDGPSRPTSGSVVGTITNIEDETPVAGATVFLVDVGTIRPATPPARTDGAGRFAFAGVAPGDYSAFVYTCDRLIFDRSTPVIQVRAGETAEQRTRLLRSELWSCRGYRIAGTVVDAGSLAPLPGSYVETWGWAAQDFPFESGVTVPETAITDSLGRFTITSAVATDEMGNEIGLFPVSVSRFDYEATTLVGDVTAGYGLPFLPLPSAGDSTLNVEVRLHPLDSRGIGPHGAGALSGSVTYLGRPIAGLRVAVSLWESANPDTFISVPLDVTVPVPDRIAVTDAEGRFTIDRLAPGRYAVHPGYPDGDGYTAPFGFGEPVDVADAETTAVAAIPMYRAIAPIFPEYGAAVATRAPEFRWEKATDCPGDVAYRLWFTQGHLFSSFIETNEPRWQPSDSLFFDPGAHVRWFVEAFCVDGPDQREEAATFETIATFTIAP